MTIEGLMKHTVVVGLLFLSGCDAARAMRDDLARLASPAPASKPAARPTAAAPRPRPPAAATPPSVRNATEPQAATASASTPAEQVSPSTPAPTQIALAGKSEAEVRAIFGSPASEEDRPPGKRWRYRDGPCTLDVQLYPDVQTKQFGILAYEVKSDDNTDQGRRLCVAQLQSRVQSRSH